MTGNTNVSERLRHATANPSSVLNLCLTLLIVVLNILLLAALLPEPGIAQFEPDRDRRFGLWAWLSVVLMALAPMHWGLLHEAFHRQLHRSRALNDHIGRLLAVLYGAPYSILKFGHLFHHRHNRSPLDRSEYYPANSKSLGARINYFFRLLGGLYIVEFAFSAAVFAPRSVLVRCVHRQCGEAPEGLESLASQIERELLTREALRTMRIEGALVLAWVGVLVLALGAWVWMVLLTLYLRGMVVSLLDNAFHYGGPLNDLRAAYNAHLPRWLSMLVLHSNYHGIHHHYPRVPWVHLPDIFTAPCLAESSEKRSTDYDGGYAQMVLRQLRGPIFSDRT